MTGTLADYVDTQNVQLENNTLGIIFTQASNIRLYMDAKLTRRQRTSSEFDNLLDLTEIAIEADVMLTEPEIATVAGWMAQSNNWTDQSFWKVRYTKEGGATWTSFNGLANITKLEFQDPGVGASKYLIRLEYSQTGFTVENETPP